jgi:hypothetical protein
MKENLSYVHAMVSRKLRMAHRDQAYELYNYFCLEAVSRLFLEEALLRKQ